MLSLMFEISYDTVQEQSIRRRQIHSRVSMHKEEIEVVMEMLVESSQTKAKQTQNLIIPLLKHRYSPYIILPKEG